MRIPLHFWLAGGAAPYGLRMLSGKGKRYWLRKVWPALMENGLSAEGTWTGIAVICYGDLDVALI